MLSRSLLHFFRLFHSRTESENKISPIVPKEVYFFLSLPALVLAVPLDSLALFLRCLPTRYHQHMPMSVTSVEGKKYIYEKTQVRHTLLTGRLLDLGCLSKPDEAVVGLEFFKSLIRVVNQSKASRLATTVLCAETENRDLVLISLVHLSEPSPEIVLGDIYQPVNFFRP